jgi:glycerophosphoryl diester phosphodiesterase
MDGVHPLFNVVDKDYVDMCHALGMTVNVWTVNEEADIRHMLEIGVDRVIGNYPDLGKKITQP